MHNRFKLKKISRLVSRKDSVPDDIKQASLKPKIIDGVYKYFSKLVLADLNQNLKYDVFENLCKVIEQDIQIAKLKKSEFLELHKNAQYDKFLADIFLYILTRDNKKITTGVEYQEIPFLEEVNYECPLMHEKLVEYVKNVPMRRFTITQIFPDDLSNDEIIEFEKVCARPADYDSTENLIALSEKASEAYLLNPTTYESLEDVEKLHIDEYRDFLAEKYEVNTEGLSWRGAMSKFIRVYKRETMDEERPLQAAKAEQIKDAIKKYMQQFGKYAIVEAQIKQAADAEDEKEAFRKSQLYNHIRGAKNQKEYDENEKKIVEHIQREKELSENSSQGLLDLDSIQAQRLSELNDLLISYRRQRAKVQTQLNSIRREMLEGKKTFKKTFSDLEKYFPESEFKALEDVEKFHQSLAELLTAEFKETEKDLATAYILLGNEIVKIKDQIAEIKRIPNVTQAVLKEYARITSELFNVQEANKSFKTLERLKSLAQKYAQTRDEVIERQLSDIQTQVNSKMREISARILKNTTQRSPELKLEKLSKYSFSTRDDGGSGAQFRGLITFDLANMEISNIPFVVHDPDLLDPIEKPALTEIIKEYNAVGVRSQQAFVSFRSLGFYAEEAQPIITGCKIIELSSGGNELFGRAWNKEPIKV